MGLMLDREAFEAGEARRGEGDEDGAAVASGLGAARQPLGLEAVHDGRGVAVRDEEHP